MTENHPTTAQIFKHLAKATRKKEHPFRFFSLASPHTSYPGLRTVVLREVDQKGWIELYTDRRSPKVMQFKQNPNSSALFYHPKKKWQLLLKGRMEEVQDEDYLERQWHLMPDYSRSDYSSSLPPGSVVHSGSSLEWKAEGRSNFAIFRLCIEEMESLQLLKTAHQRYRYTRQDGDWKKERLTP